MERSWVIARLVNASRDLEERLPVWVRVVSVAYVSAAAQEWPGLWSLTVLIIVMVFWPISLLAPKRRRDEISLESYLSLSMPFLSGILLLFLAAYGLSPAHDFPTVAYILLAGSVLLWVIMFAKGLNRRPVTFTVWLCAVIWGLAGVIPELPGPPPLSTVAFVLYGTTAAIVGTAMFAEVEQ